MTPTEMEATIKNLDIRFARVEQILPTLATKEDLKAFATKEDLKAFATKEDLKAFATKEDLETVATKEDLSREIGGLRSQMMALVESVQADVRLLAEHLSGVLEWIREQRAKS